VLPRHAHGGEFVNFIVRPHMYVIGNATGVFHFCEQTGENIWK